MSTVRYSKVTRRLWGDATFRSLRAAEPSPRELWLYLLTCPEQCAVPGIFRAFEGGVADALGWTVGALREAWGEVSAKGLARADWRAGVVVLPKAFFHNQPDSPNHVIGWRSAWEEIPECELKTQYFHELKGLVEGLGKPYLEAYTKALREPCRHQEQEQEQEQDPDTEESTREPPDTEVRLKVAARVSSKPSKPRRGTKTTIPADWSPSARCLELVASEGIPDGVARACIADFVDYWTGEGGLKADWNAAFRGRIRWLKSHRQLPEAQCPEEESSYVESIANVGRVRRVLLNGIVVRTEPLDSPHEQQKLPEAG